MGMASSSDTQGQVAPTCAPLASSVPDPIGSDP